MTRQNSRRDFGRLGIIEVVDFCAYSKNKYTKIRNEWCPNILGARLPCAEEQ